MNNEQLFDLTSPPSAEFDTAVAAKNSKREKNVTIKCDFGIKYQEVRKHPIAEK